MKRALIDDTSSKTPFSFAFQIPEESYKKKNRTRQETQIESIFENLMSQCDRNGLNPELVTRFITLHPASGLLNQLFQKALHCHAPMSIVSPLVQSALHQIQTSPSLEDKNILLQMFNSALKEKLPDITLSSIARQLLKTNLSIDESVLLAIDTIDLGEGYKQTNSLLIKNLKTKDPTSQDLEALIEYYLQINTQGALPYPDLTTSIAKMLVKKDSHLDSLNNFFTMANNATNSHDIVPILLDAILEKDTSLETLLFLSSQTKIQSLPEELLKVKKLLTSAFIQNSDIPELKTFSLDFFEENSPVLYAHIIDWITRFEKGLIHTDDFKNPELCSSFVSSVVNILKFAQENTEYRDICHIELVEALRSCKDQAALFLNNLILHKQVIESRELSIEGMLPIFKRKVAIGALKEFSQAYVQQEETLLRTNPDLMDNEEWIQAMMPDAVSVQLDLECSLKRDLDLPGVISKHFFSSNLSAGNKQDAKNFVLDILRNPNKLAAKLVQKEELGSKSIWVQELLKRTKFGLETKIQSEQAPLRELQNAAYEVNAGEEGSEAEWDRQFNNLPVKHKNLFFQLLKEKPTASLYEKRSHAILGLFESIENTIALDTTIQILKILS